jgi:hypothetical protein
MERRCMGICFSVVKAERPLGQADLRDDRRAYATVRFHRSAQKVVHGEKCPPWWLRGRANPPIWWQPAAGFGRTTRHAMRRKRRHVSDRAGQWNEASTDHGRARCHGGMHPPRAATRGRAPRRLERVPHGATQTPRPSSFGAREDDVRVWPRGRTTRRIPPPIARHLVAARRARSLPPAAASCAARGSRRAHPHARTRPVRPDHRRLP